MYLQQIIESRDKELNHIISEMENKIDNNLRGNIRFSKSNGNTQFYINQGKGGNRNGTYVKKSDWKTVIKYSKNKYCKTVLKRAYKEKKLVLKLQKLYCSGMVEDVYDLFPKELQQEITPVCISDAGYVEKWLKKSSSIINSYKIDGNITTNKGEPVRSKSEKIIADILEKLGIPYKYEECLILDDGSYLFPDFTILDVKRRREIYLEHLGLMDNFEYVNRTMEKIKKYENNGIFPGVNLLLTSESENIKFNTKAFEQMIRLCLDI